MRLSDLLMPNRLTPEEYARRAAIWQPSSTSGGQNLTKYPQAGYTNPAYKPGFVWGGRVGWLRENDPRLQKLIPQRCPTCGQVLSRQL